MAKYQVLRPIEHNEKLYLPEHSHIPAAVKSAGNGQVISCDASGAIELNEAEAKVLLQGRIEPSTGSSAPKKDHKG